MAGGGGGGGGGDGGALPLLRLEQPDSGHCPQRREIWAWGCFLVPLPTLLAVSRRLSLPPSLPPSAVVLAALPALFRRCCGNAGSVPGVGTEGRYRGRRGRGRPAAAPGGAKAPIPAGQRGGTSPGAGAGPTALPQPRLQQPQGRGQRIGGSLTGSPLSFRGSVELRGQPGVGFGVQC